MVSGQDGEVCCDAAGHDEGGGDGCGEIGVFHESRVSDTHMVLQRSCKDSGSRVWVANFGEESTGPHGSAETAKFGELGSEPHGLAAPVSSSEERFSVSKVMMSKLTVRPGANEGERFKIGVDQRQNLEANETPHGTCSRMTDTAQEVQERRV